MRPSLLPEAAGVALRWSVRSGGRCSRCCGRGEVGLDEHDVQGHDQRRHPGLAARLDAVRAAEGARRSASVVYIVLDDVGFSAMSCYGGPIETPNIDRIAAAGVRYTQWHTTALCSPTRSCLLTGRNHTRNSMACITEAAIGFPNASGTIPPENGMLSEILGERGWNTYMVGKWHLCPDDEMNLASTRRNWPSGRGFERWYGFLGAETSQWYPDLVYDNHLVDQPKSPEEGYHLTVDITDKAIEFIRDAKAVAPEKPFFLYYAPGAATRRITPRRSGSTSTRVGSTWATRRCASRRWPARRSWASSRPDTELPPINPIGTPETRTGPDGKPFPPVDVTRPWDSLSDDEKALFCPDGRGLRRVPGPCRRPDRAPARVPRGVRLAREHDRRARVRQRRLRRGRPERLGERDEVRQRHPGHRRGQHAAARRARQPEDLQPLPERLGDGLQHAIQDVEALRVQRRHERPVHHLVARRHEGEGRDPRAVPPRDRPRADDPGRRSASSRRRDQGPRPEPVRRRQHALQLRRRRRRRRRGGPSSTRCSGRGRSGTTAGRRSRTTRRSPAGVTSTTTSGSSTTPRSTAPSSTTWPPSTPTRCASS